MLIIYEFFKSLMGKDEEDPNTKRVTVTKCDTISYDEDGEVICYSIKKDDDEEEDNTDKRPTNQKPIKTGML